MKFHTRISVSFANLSLFWQKSNLWIISVWEILILFIVIQEKKREKKGRPSLWECSFGGSRGLMITLIDLGLSCNPFKWSNKRHAFANVKEQLDGSGGCPWWLVFLISKGINRHLLIPLQTMSLLSLILVKMLLESIDLLDLKLYGWWLLMRVALGWLKILGPHAHKGIEGHKTIFLDKNSARRYFSWKPW